MERRINKYRVKMSMCWAGIEAKDEEEAREKAYDLFREEETTNGIIKESFSYEVQEK